jgi:hypothetical protein
MNAEGFAFFAWIRFRGRYQQCSENGWNCLGCRNEWNYLQRCKQ